MEFSCAQDPWKDHWFPWHEPEVCEKSNGERDCNPTNSVFDDRLNSMHG